MKKLIAKFLCWRYGHKRGKRVMADIQREPWLLSESVPVYENGKQVFECPRCGGSRKMRKVK